MKIKETRKLFYGKYVYKIQLETFSIESTHALMALIRGMPYFGNIVKFNNLPDEVVECMFIIASILNSYVYKIRAERKRISVFTNNHTLVHKLANCIYDIHVLSRPRNQKVKQFLLTHKNIIIDWFTYYKFKVTMKHFTTDAELYRFIAWVRKSPGLHLGAFNPPSIYIESKKHLLLAQVYLGSDITKIEEIVHYNNLTLS